MCTNLLPSVEYDRLVAHAASVPPVEELLKENQPVDEERKALRTQTLKKLALVLKVWARMVVYQTGQPDKVVSQKHLKLLPFGSYKYDDTSKDSDIDLLCVTSRYITRKHFFHDLCRLFEGMKEVEAFTVITSAFVPLMKMKFNGVALDICFTQLNCSCVPSKFDLAYISKMPIGMFPNPNSLPIKHILIISYTTLFLSWLFRFNFFSTPFRFSQTPHNPSLICVSLIISFLSSREPGFINLTFTVNCR